MPRLHAFPRALRRLHLFALSSDWLVGLFVSLVIGQRNYFGCGFSTVMKTAPYDHVNSKIILPFAAKLRKTAQGREIDISEQHTDCTTRIGPQCEILQAHKMTRKSTLQKKGLV